MTATASTSLSHAPGIPPNEPGLPRPATPVVPGSVVFGDVHDAAGQTLACCFDARKALCRKGTGPTTPATTPDLTACEDRCANIARTDRHIAAVEADIEALQAELDAPLTPAPLRHRIELQITHRENVIKAHQETRGGQS